MKNKTKLIFSTILALLIIALSAKVQAASASISASKETADVGETVSIEVKVNAATWNLKVTGNGISEQKIIGYDMEGKNVTTTKKITLDTSVAKTYTISLTGDITDADETNTTINNSVKVTINEKVVKPDPEPEQNPEPEPETPTKPTTSTEQQKELEFKAVNETVYATGTVNVRKSYSADSTKLGQLKEGNSVTRIGISKTADKNNDYWSKITYNGQTAYVISSKLTTTNPEEQEIEKTPEDEETEVTVEEPKEDTTELKEGLKSLEIEEVTLSPNFRTDVYEYEAVLKKDLSSLNIKAVANNGDVKIVLAGNENIQEGENLITIILYNKNNEPEATYQIVLNKSTLNLKETDETLKIANKDAKIRLIIYVAALLVTVIILIIVLILKRRINNEEYDYRDNQTIEFEKDNIQENVRVKEKKKGKHF